MGQNFKEERVMQINYDKEVDILTIDFTDTKPVESEHLIDKGIIIDYDENDNIVGIEILDWSKRKTIDLPVKVKQIQYSTTLANKQM